MKDNNAAKRILSVSDAEVFRRHGWQAADLHVHTIFSPDVISVGSMHPEKLYLRARENGMDYVTFTDHDTLDAYDILNPDMPGLVRGVEIKIKDRSIGHTIHVNVYELDRGQFQILEEIATEGDLHGFLDCLETERLPFVYNHPLWFEPGERPNLKAIPDLVELFPVIEYNMHRVRRKNEMIVELAERHGKGLIASTDTHSGMIGQAYTLSRGKSFRKFFNNIRAGKSFIVVGDLTKQNLVHEMKLWLDLLSGQEDINSKREIHTGISQVDRLIALLSSNTLRDFPRVYRAFLAATYKLAGSGLPAALYIRRECFRICQMEQQLGIYAH
ncbi:MAG TPA: PHP-associated domain-containing protein [Methanothrix sp.]|nr:PHP-associated domain-containing protein [Methanothrix sp.]